MQNHIIDTHRVMEYYEIYVDGEFEQSCDVGELSDALAEVESRYENK